MVVSQVLERSTMARKKPKDEPADEGREPATKSAKIKTDVHRAARIIALSEGILLEDLLDSIIRPED
jgi:hypothetical protein